MSAFRRSSIIPPRAIIPPIKTLLAENAVRKNAPFGNRDHLNGKSGADPTADGLSAHRWYGNNRSPPLARRRADGLEAGPHSELSLTLHVRDRMDHHLPHGSREGPSDSRSPAFRTASVGALAVGAIALAALAIGAVAIGRLAIGRARIKRLEIDELVVRRRR